MHSYNINDIYPKINVNEYISFLKTNYGFDNVLQHLVDNNICPLYYNEIERILKSGMKL